VTLSSNGKFKYKTVNTTSDMMESFASFQDTCEMDYIFNVTAGSICGAGLPVTYTVENQGECSELKIKDIPEFCCAFVTEGPMGCRKNKANNGNGIYAYHTLLLSLKSIL
jgi:hypothetical protein